MKRRGCFLAAILLLCACEKPAESPGEPQGRPEPRARPEPLVVYASYEDENYLPSMFAAFTHETGIRVTVRHRPEQQIVSEVIEKRGSPPADVLLTRSVHGVWQAADEGALLPLQSEKVAGTVPGWLRDPDGYWTAVGFVSTDVVCNADNQSDCDLVEKYEDLGKPEFRSRLCLSSASLAVSRSLIASLIADHGVRPAEIIVRGWIANLALPPFASDRELLQAIEAGTCAVGVVSGLALHQFNRPTVAGIWPQPGYIGVEAVGIGRHARSPDAARQLVEWFVGHEAQAANYSASGLWPVNPAARAEPFDYPASKSHPNAGIAGANEVDAIKLAERAAWR